MHASAGGEAEGEIQRHGDAGHGEAEAQRRPGVGLGQRGEAGGETLAQCFGEHHGQRQARQSEDDLQVVRGQPGTEPALRAEQQYIDQARHHRRHREGQIDECPQQGLAGEAVARHGPGGGEGAL